jgi:ribosomal protein S18 acetylase RimI-like enzyme
VSAIVLRLASERDRELLRAVYESSRADELALVAWQPGQREAFVEQQFAAQDRFYREHYPTATFSVVEVDGEPAGRLYVDRWSGEIRLMDIALLAPFRRRGIGERLIRGLQEEVAVSGRRLTLHVERYSPALRLYARLGFRAVEERGGVYLLLEWRPEQSPATAPPSASPRP